MKWITRSAVAVALAAQLAGCTSQPEPTYTNSGGTLAISRDDALLFAVDEDNELVAIIDANTQKKIADVQVGAAPSRIVASEDNTLYVTNRGSRNVSVVKSVGGEWKETAKIEVGIEPNGLALSPDAKTLFVVNATSLESTDFGTLTAIDTKSNQIKWELPVGEEPRGIALTEGGNKALISLYKRGDLVQVDLTKPEVVKAPPTDRKDEETAKTGMYYQVNKTAIEPFTASPGSGRLGTTSRFIARSAADVVVTPDGQRAFVPVIWSREDAITAPPTVFGGYYGSGGPCNVGAIATPGIVTVEANTAEAKVDDLTSCGTVSNGEDFPVSTMANPEAASTGPIQGPVTGVVDLTGEYLYVVNRESNNVAIMPTGRRSGDDLVSTSALGSSVRKVVPVGNGPTGIALSRDGKKAYVYNSFDHSISVLEGRGEGANAQVLVSAKIENLAPKFNAAKGFTEAQWDDIWEGRRLFFSAYDKRMTNPATGTSCNTCHLDAREDGHTWIFPDGPRQTPSLAGRKLGATAPYHWSGEFDTLQAFLSHTVTMRMGGSMTASARMSEQIFAYLDYVKPPDNPFKRAEPSTEQIRGAQVFQKAECNSCHAGEAFTNNTNADVGTLVRTTRVSDKVSQLNTPSLLGLARSAPFLHDGSAGTLKARLMMTKNTNLHGKTSTLSDAEMDDLVSYLNSL